MFRSSPLAVAVLCTAALAACSDTTTTGATRGGDPLVNASNQNLGAELVFEATQSETVTPGMGPSSYVYCDTFQPAYTVSGTESGAPGSNGANLAYDQCYPYEPPPPYEEPVDPPPPPPPPPPVQQPIFDTPVPSITGSMSLGNKTVNLNASGAFNYASFGQLTAIFQNAGGCYSTPTEYSRSTVSAQNGPFTLAASRSASYNGTSTYINWGVHVTSYAESPEGGAQSKISASSFCY